jgi:D-aminopeptidase
VDARIQRLDGLRFSGLPTKERQRFLSFSIQVVDLTDYLPEEPFELTYGYTVRFVAVGTDDAEVGPPTQMAVFWCLASRPVGVKTAFGDRAAEGLHHDESCSRIESAARTALANRADVHAATFAGDIDLEVDMLRLHMTELSCSIPGVELRGPLTLDFRAADFPAPYNMIDIFAVLAASA